MIHWSSKSSTIYSSSKSETMFAFVKGVYAGKGDDGCVVPAGSIHVGTWKELADRKWEGIQYRLSLVRTSALSSYVSD